MGKPTGRGGENKGEREKRKGDREEERQEERARGGDIRRGCVQFVFLTSTTDALILCLAVRINRQRRKLSDVLLISNPSQQ